MAAGSFTASQIQEAQVRMMQMFADPNISKTEWQTGEALSARALLPRQTAKTLERLTSNICVGAEIWFLRPHAADVAEEDWPETNDCDVPAGAQAESVKQDLTTAILAYAKASLLDNRCDNFVGFQEEFAEQVGHIMVRLRRQLNNNVVLPTLDASTQANLDTLIPSTWDDTTNTPRITAPPEDFKWQNLNVFRRVAMRNGFGNFFFLSGELFNDDAWMAMLNRMNEGERAAFLAWNSRDIYFDERDLDQYMTRRTAFAVDANSYAFWNTFRSPAVATLIDPANGKYVWAQPDPILTWNKNGVQTPVVWEMEMQKNCTGRDSQGFDQNTYNVSGRLLGGFVTAPTGPNGEKGVLQFSDEA